MASAGVWKQSLLKDFFWFQEGPGVRKWQFKDAGVKLLNVANIEKSRTLNLDKTDRHLDSDEVRSRYSHFLIDAGDLVIASSGISFDDDGMLRTRGAFVEEQHLPLCLNTSTIRFKAKPEKSDLRYLQHWLDSREFREQITRLVTGSAQQNFGPSHLNAIKISLPPLPEQIRIAAILDQADALRVKRREALAQLDSLTQSIFIEMFGDPVTNPKGIKQKPLGDLLKLKSGNFLPATDMVGSGSYPVFGGNGINGYHDQFMFSEPQIIIGRVGVYCGCVHVSPPKSWVTDNALYVSESAPQLNFGYLAYSLKQAKLNQYASQSAQPLISGARLYPVKILVPTLEQQCEFTGRIAAVEKLRSSHHSSLSELDSLFASLQHRAFRGDL